MKINPVFFISFLLSDPCICAHKGVSSERERKWRRRLNKRKTWAFSYVNHECISSRYFGSIKYLFVLRECLERKGEQIVEGCRDWKDNASNLPLLDQIVGFFVTQLLSNCTQRKFNAFNCSVFCCSALPTLLRERSNVEECWPAVGGVRRVRGKGEDRKLKAINKLMGKQQQQQHLR